jgi:hypothetical protein
MPKPTHGSNASRIIFTSLAIVVLTVVVTFLWLNKRTSNDYSPYAARDLGSAATVCEQKIDKNLGASLLHKRYDDISSRYEASKKRYVIYYRLSVKNSAGNGASEQFAKCVIWESRGYVTGFEVIDL